MLWVHVPVVLLCCLTFAQTAPKLYKMWSVCQVVELCFPELLWYGYRLKHGIHWRNQRMGTSQFCQLCPDESQLAHASSWHLQLQLQGCKCETALSTSWSYICHYVCEGGHIIHYIYINIYIHMNEAGCCSLAIIITLDMPTQFSTV